MGVTGKPNFVVPAQKRKLTTLASSYASRALMAKSDYLLHQAAACAFIGLSMPERALRDIVQIRVHRQQRRAEQVFLDYGGWINDLKDQVLEIATEEEWDTHLLIMDRSKLMTHDHDHHLPIDDLHLGDSDCKHHTLVEQAKYFLNIYHYELRDFVYEARKSHSRSWVDKVLHDLFLTKCKAKSRGHGKRDKAKTAAKAMHERVTPFGEQRMVKGKLRKPFKNALVVAAVFTAVAGVAYVL